MGYWSQSVLESPGTQAGPWGSEAKSPFDQARQKHSCYVEKAQTTLHSKTARRRSHFPMCCPASPCRTQLQRQRPTEHCPTTLATIFRRATFFDPFGLLHDPGAFFSSVFSKLFFGVAFDRFALAIRLSIEDEGEHDKIKKNSCDTVLQTTSACLRSM